MSLPAELLTSFARSKEEFKLDFCRQVDQLFGLFIKQIQAHLQRTSGQFGVASVHSVPISTTTGGESFTTTATSVTSNPLVQQQHSTINTADLNGLTSSAEFFSSPSTSSNHLLAHFDSSAHHYPSSVGHVPITASDLNSKEHANNNIKTSEGGAHEVYPDFYPDSDFDPGHDGGGSDSASSSSGQVKRPLTTTANHPPLAKRSKAFPCRVDSCTQSFHRNEDLQHHHRLFHEGQPIEPSTDKPFPCTQPGCPKTFKSKSELVQHQRIHTCAERKPFKCRWPECNFEAVQQGSVIRHIKSIHFKIPRYKKDQKEAGIVDERDPKQYVEVVKEFL